MPCIIPFFPGVTLLALVGGASSFLEAQGETWSPPELLGPSDGQATNPLIAVDEKRGYAYAIWRQHGDIRAFVYANRFAPGIGWTGAEQVSDDGGTVPFSLQLELHQESGTVWAVWQQTSPGGEPYRIFASSTSPGVDWSPPVLVNNPGCSARGTVALDVEPETGTAHVVWVQSAGPHCGQSTSNLFHASNTAGIWSPPVRVSEPTADGFPGHSPPALAYNSVTGALHAAWSKSTDAFGSDKLFAYVRSEEGWAAEFAVHPTPAQRSLFPRLICDPVGGVVVLTWNQGPTTGPKTFFASYLVHPKGEWSEPQAISGEGEAFHSTLYLARTELVADPKGNILAAFIGGEHQLFDSDVHARVFESSTREWLPAIQVSEDVGNAEGLSLTLEAGTGAARLVWLQYFPELDRSSVFSARLPNLLATMWEPASLVTDDGRAPACSVGGHGAGGAAGAAVIWRRSSPTFALSAIYASHTPPL